MLLGFKVFKNYPKNKNIRARVKPVVRKKSKKKTIFGNKFKKIVCY